MSALTARDWWLTARSERSVAVGSYPWRLPTAATAAKVTRTAAGRSSWHGVVDALEGGLDVERGARDVALGLEYVDAVGVAGGDAQLGSLRVHVQGPHLGRVHAFQVDRQVAVHEQGVVGVPLAPPA